MSKLYMALQVLKFMAQFVPQPKRPTPDWSRLQDASARLHRTPSLANIAEPAVTSASPVAVSARIAMPTTVETVDELKRRLGKELYRMELDLLGGGRIAGKSCDCLSGKHHLGLEATAEELIPMDGNLAYGQILSWLDSHKEEFEPEEIEKRPPEYYQAMAQDVRRFRKDIMGTESPSAMLTEGERSRVLAQINPAALPKAVPGIPVIPEVAGFVAAFDRSYAKSFAGMPEVPPDHHIGLRGIAEQLGMDFKSPAFKSRVEKLVEEGTFTFAPAREAKNNLLIRMPGILHEQSIGLAAKRPMAKVTPITRESPQFPKREEALRDLGEYKVVEYHDDGDLTVTSQGRLYVVTTEGQTFEQVV